MPHIDLFVESWLTMLLSRRPSLIPLAQPTTSTRESHFLHGFMLVMLRRTVPSPPSQLKISRKKNRFPFCVCWKFERIASRRMASVGLCKFEDERRTSMVVPGIPY